VKTANVSAVTINCVCIIGGFSVLVGNHFGSSHCDKIFSMSQSVRLFERRPSLGGFHEHLALNLAFSRGM